jgi:hypothetical protein
MPGFDKIRRRGSRREGVDGAGALASPYPAPPLLPLLRSPLLQRCEPSIRAFAPIQRPVAKMRNWRALPKTFPPFKSPRAFAQFRGKLRPGEIGVKQRRRVVMPAGREFGFGKFGFRRCGFHGGKAPAPRCEAFEIGARGRPTILVQWERPPLSAIVFPCREKFVGFQPTCGHHAGHGARRRSRCPLKRYRVRSIHLAINRKMPQLTTLSRGAPMTRPTLPVASRKTSLARCA